MNLIRKLVALAGTNKLFNWLAHGAIVAIITLLFAIFGELMLGVNIAFSIYLWRELETVFTRWVSTGVFKVSEKNLGDLIGPVIVFAFVHLLV